LARILSFNIGAGFAHLEVILILILGWICAHLGLELLGD
jgi:hypothetical protein